MNKGDHFYYSVFICNIEHSSAFNTVYQYPTLCLISLVRLAMSQRLTGRFIFRKYISSYLFNDALLISTFWLPLHLPNPNLKHQVKSSYTVYFLLWFYVNTSFAHVVYCNTLVYVLIFIPL